MDTQTFQDEIQVDETPRTLRLVFHIFLAVSFLAIVGLVIYGFLNFSVSGIELGSRLYIGSQDQEGELLTCESSPHIVIHYQGFPANTITAKIDGKDFPIKRQGIYGKMEGDASALEDGPHTIEVKAGRYHNSWEFSVDTDVPVMTIKGPAEKFATVKNSVTFYGTTKPFTNLTVKVSKEILHHNVDEDGTFKLVLPLQQGRNTIKWTVSDKAGNTVSGERVCVSDQSVPSIDPVVCSLDGSEQASPKSVETVFSSQNLVLKLTVKDPESGIKETSYTLDKNKAVDLPIPDVGENSEDDEEPESDTEDTATSLMDSGDDDNAVTSIEEDVNQLDYKPSKRQGKNSEAFVQLQSGGDEPKADSKDGESASANKDATKTSKADKGTSKDEGSASSESESDMETIAEENLAQSLANKEKKSSNKRKAKEPPPLKEISAKGLRVRGEPLIDGAKGRCTVYQIPLNKLYDGDHLLSVVSTNGIGMANKRSLKFKVNSSEKFGEAILYLGAHGADVEELQKRLANRGYLTGDYHRGHYDETTRDAVIALQRHIGADPDGVTGPMVYGALDRRVYVNLSQYSIKLVMEDDSVHTYQCAIGVDEYPTPDGWFYIADMVKNPSWLPPDSEWAKDAEQIDPGPDNPLGTRWIGLDNGSIGFHGTLFPDSVGTKASHGCMRMRLIDIEDFYDRVTVGTQVRIYKGDENDSVLRQYWP